MSIREPKYGDPVHVTGWKEPNGKVIAIEVGDSVVVKSLTSDERTDFDYDTVCQSWTDKFEGTYLLNVNDY